MPKVITTADTSGFTTDAKFRAWGLAQSTALASCGLVQTADTGQINWATVTKPTAAQTTAGYEIWRFDDALQSTAPIYIKLLYGSGQATSGNNPNVQIQIGIGTNGSGTLTGIATAVNTSGSYGNSTNAPTNAAATSYFTHTTGYALMVFSLAMTSNAGNTAGFFAIDRTRDDTGAATADGCTLMKMGSNVSQGSITSINFNTGFTVTGTRFPATGNVAISNIATASTVPIYKSWAGVPHLVPHVGWVGFFNTNISPLVTFTCAPFGATAHTYMAMTGYITGFDWVGTSAINAAVLWED